MMRTSNLVGEEDNKLVANGGKKGNNSKAPREAATCRHPEVESPLRPAIGTQEQFRQRIVLMLQEGAGSEKSNP
jgi:hypothetical protein